MTPEKKEKLKEIRQRMANLSEGERQALTARGMTATVEGRVLSLRNTLLVALQDPAATVVGGYQQWRKSGRQVKRGEHGVTIWFPVGSMAKEDDGTEFLAAERFLLGTVFDIRQTEPMTGAASNASAA